LKAAIIDYGSGNLHSAHKAFEKAADCLPQRCSVVVTADPETIAAADFVVLPGVGAFADCKRGLESAPGVLHALDVAVKEKARPFLGVCVGMQLLAEHGREHGLHPGLGWIKGEVAPIVRDTRAWKIPHMGWNTLDPRRPHPVFDELRLGERGQHAYFVHSFEFRPTLEENTIATTDYGGPIVASVANGNIIGVQFHPEKSQGFGLAFLANFLRWRP